MDASAMQAASTTTETNQGIAAAAAVAVAAAKAAATAAAAAEEEVRIHEATLLAWRQRRDQLLTQEAHVLVPRKRALVHEKERLKKRHASLQQAQSRQIALQQELQESLNKSQERLYRLTQLEEMGTETAAALETAAATEGDVNGSNIEIDDDDDDDNNIKGIGHEGRHGRMASNDDDENGVEQGGSSGISQQSRTNQQGEEIDDVIVASHHNEDNDPGYVDPIFEPGDREGVDLPALDNSVHDENALDFSRLPVLTNLKSLTALQDYHRLPSLPSQTYQNQNHPQNVRPLGFLPFLDATTVAKYLEISIREAEALDASSKDLATSLRRNLLADTTLDISLLVETSWHNNNDCDATIKNEKGTIIHPSLHTKTVPLNMPFDPNLSLCPYELSGVCADDLCPYQHTTKIPKVVARERLPLPSLASFVTPPTAQPSNNAALDDNVKSLDTDKKSAGDQQKKSDDTGKAESNESDSEQPIREEEREKQESWSLEDQDDFLALPVAPSDDAKDGNSDSDEEDTMKLDDSSNDDTNESGPEKTDAGASMYISAALHQSASTTKQEEVNITDSNRRGVLWWGGQLPTLIDSRTPFSIVEILETRFGIRLHKDSDDPSQIRIEIKGLDYKSRSSSLVDAIKTLGRVVDAIRLALHGGRVDIAMTINKALHEDLLDGSSEGSIGFYSEMKALLHLVEEQTNAFWWHDRERSSCFRTIAAVQIGVAMVSSSLFILWEDIQLDDAAETTINLVLLSSLFTTCRDCWQLMRNSAPTNQDEKSSSCLEDLAQLLHRVHLEAERSIETAFENAKDLITWNQSAFVSKTADSFDSSTQAMEERLSNVTNIVKKYMQGRDSSKRPIFSAVRTLKAAIVVSTAVIECISGLAFIICRGGMLQEDEDPAALSTSVHAGWTALDITTFRILKEMRSLLAVADPMMDLILAPIFGVCVVSASFLRNYSFAQNRLLDCLGDGLNNGGRHRKNAPPNKDSLMSLLPFSELLWSQLIQLRMSMPAEAVRQGVGGRSRPIKESRLPGNCDVRLLAGKLGQLDIRLHHLAPYGDWILSMTAAKDNNQVRKWAIQSVMKAATGQSKMASLCMIDFADPAGQDGRQYHPSPPLSPLPFFVLQLGQSLTNLDLSKCKLVRLPLSFGLCFPNLKRLDLGCNLLQDLPKSFEQLPKRMPHLEKFVLVRNHVQSLPDEIFTSGQQERPVPWPLQLLDLSHNRLSCLPPLPPESLLSLEELVLGNNCLMDMTLIDFSRIALKLPRLRNLVVEPQQQIHDPAH